MDDAPDQHKRTDRQKDIPPVKTSNLVLFLPALFSAFTVLVIVGGVPQAKPLRVTVWLLFPFFVAYTIGLVVHFLLKRKWIPMLIAICLLVPSAVLVYIICVLVPRIRPSF
jgi:hypothetical protein